MKPRHLTLVAVGLLSSCALQKFDLVDSFDEPAIGGSAGAESGGSSGEPSGGMKSSAAGKGNGGGKSEGGGGTESGGADAGTAGQDQSPGQGGEGGFPDEQMSGCPTKAPSNGASCGGDVAECTYAERLCECSDVLGKKVWRCVTNPKCSNACTNTSCKTDTAMCTSKYGKCTDVPCGDDSDCCGLAACDDLTTVCAEQRSRLFVCSAGLCKRNANPSYVGLCKQLDDLVPSVGTCSASCPALRPTGGNYCTVPATKTCPYGSDNCKCVSAPETNGYRWQCLSGGA